MSKTQLDTQKPSSEQLPDKPLPPPTPARVPGRLFPEAKPTAWNDQAPVDRNLAEEVRRQLARMNELAGCIEQQIHDGLDPKDIAALVKVASDLRKAVVAESMDAIGKLNQALREAKENVEA